MAAGSPIMPPGSSQGNPDTGDQGPGVGGGFPAATPAQTNPNMEQALLLIKNIVGDSRRLASLFPSAVAEVRAINNSVARLSQKIQQSGPAPEPMAPPV